MSGSTTAAPPPPGGPSHQAADGQWRAVSWDEALDGVAKDLVHAATAWGAGAMAIYSGRSAMSAAAAASMLGQALGTERVFAWKESDEAALAWAAARVLGHTARLVPDLDRAHHVLWLGRGHPGGPGFRTGPEQPRRSLTVAHARQAPPAVRIHLLVRPGSETFLVLGLAGTILAREWHDAQYLRDWTVGLPEAIAALGPWPPERCAARCGIPVDALVAEALRFARAPMAVASGHPEVFRTPLGGLLAWSLLLLHASTANALRPGGLYAALPMPGSGIADRPGSRFRRHARRSDHLDSSVAGPTGLLGPPDPPRALLALGGLPTDDYGPVLSPSIDALELIVQIGSATSEPHRRTRWILPGTDEPGGRQVEDVLRALRARVLEARPRAAPLRGLSRVLREHLLQGGPRRPWRHFAPASHPHGVYEDRARWDVVHADGRLHLFPPPSLGNLSDTWPDPSRSFALFAGDPETTREGEPRLGLHPEVGRREGARVRVDTASGSFEARVRLDPSIRTDAAEASPLPAQAGVLDVLDESTLEPWRHGAPCHIDMPSTRHRQRGPS